MAPDTIQEIEPRRLRADARRNYDALLTAGHEVFAAHGVDAPFDDVARRAGVGRGTLYRHFPTREHLFAVLVQQRLDLLRQRARELIDAPDAAGAVEEWLHVYRRSVRQYVGMSARLGEALRHPGDSPVATACMPMRAAFDDLLMAAQRRGAIRPDITSVEVLALVSALPDADDRADPYLAVVLSGLRAQPAAKRRNRR